MSTKVKSRWLLKTLVIIAMVLAALIILLQFYQAEWKTSAKTDLRFKSVNLPFVHEFDGKNMLPFLASAAFDADGDGVDELFLGGGIGQADALFRFTDKGFVETSANFEKSDDEATHGAAHIDLDEDGDVDLFTAHTNSVWYHENTGNSFKSQKLDFVLAENTTPLSLALGDPNNDGKADLYISGYIKLDKVQGETIFSEGYGGKKQAFGGNTIPSPPSLPIPIMIAIATLLSRKIRALSRLIKIMVPRHLYPHQIQVSVHTLWELASGIIIMMAILTY